MACEDARLASLCVGSVCRWSAERNWKRLPVGTRRDVRLFGVHSEYAGADSMR